MWLFGKLFGGSGIDKKGLIKELVKVRVRVQNDPMAEAMGLSDNMVDSLGMCMK